MLEDKEIFFKINYLKIQKHYHASSFSLPIGIDNTITRGYIKSIETKSRCGRQELLAAPVRTTGCSLTKRGTKAEMLINPRDGFLPDSLGDQREVGFGVSAEDSCDRRNFAASRDRI